MLGAARVLDLTDEKGYLCGRILADLGADVIKVEPPGGDPGRRIGPFYHDVCDPDKSLHWFAYNANKRGITLNLETADGCQIFKRLVKTADFVIESFPPGHMNKLSLGYSTLNGINPRIILTSITPFGQTGPWRDYRGSDIVLWALSSYMYVNGDPDRPPVQISFPQSYLQGGLEAAVGTLFAHYYRGVSGEGQWIDVSIQEALAGISLQNQQQWDLTRANPRRAGAYADRPGHIDRPGAIYRQRRIWPCKDGYITFLIMGGPLGAQFNPLLTEWMDKEGFAPELMKRQKWEELDYEAPRAEEFDIMVEAVENFFKSHTKDELWQWAIENNVMLCPVATPKDIVENPQLQSRDFWIELEHPELEAFVTYPGAFAKSSETSCTLRRRAPLIGEHNEEVYGEIGFSKQDLLLLKQVRVI